MVIFHSYVSLPEGSGLCIGYRSPDVKICLHSSKSSCFITVKISKAYFITSMNFTAYICFQFFLAELAELLLSSPQKFGRFPHISSRSRGPTPMPAISGVWVPWLVSCSLVSRLSLGRDPTRSPQEPASA